jgi:cytochrome b pre-mRNA-processing protein 3
MFRRRPYEQQGRSLYSAVVAQARHREFYADLGIPDTMDGRFDMIVLHAFLVMERLKGQGEEAEGVARALVEALFDDMDASLRELGVADLGVGRRVKQMMDGLYGRFDAYRAAVAADDGGHALRVALDNNLFGTVETSPARLEAMAGYLRREVLAMSGRPVGALTAGTVGFGPPPAAPPA